MRKCLLTAWIFLGALQLQGAVRALPVEDLLGEYLKMKDALVADNTWGAAMAGGRMVMLLQVADGDGRASRLRACADQVSGSADIAVQRRYFAELSAMAERALRVLGAGRNHVYVHHCPMALDGSGALWLSLHPEVQNPYFGERMMRCGKVIWKCEGAAAAAPLAPGGLPGRLQGHVMHGCHGPGR